MCLVISPWCGWVGADLLLSGFHHLFLSSFSVAPCVALPSLSPSVSVSISPAPIMAWGKGHPLGVPLSFPLHNLGVDGRPRLHPAIAPPRPLAQSLSEGWILLSKPSAVVTSSVSSSPRQSRCSLSYRTCQCLGFLIYKVGIVADIGNVRKHPLKKENIHENNYPTH